MAARARTVKALGGRRYPLDTLKKYRILYAEYEWKQQRLLPILLIAAGLFFGIQGLQSHNRSNLIWLGYIPMAALWGGFYFLRRNRHYVQPAEDGLRVGRTFSSFTIPYDVIRTARVLPLRQLIPEPAEGKRRYMPPPVKASLDNPAVVLRFQGEPAAIAEVSKKLGSRHVFDGSAAFPVADADGAVKEIGHHLPLGAAGGTNMGGARRRGRKRR